MHAWFDVTAGVAGDMLMGALIDAGADLAAVREAVRAVAGDDIVVRPEQVIRAGLRAIKIHVDIRSTSSSGTRTWPRLRRTVLDARLHPWTKSLALQALNRLVDGYARGHLVAVDEVALDDVAALDVLADIVGDCEALRLLAVESVSASTVALGSGRIRTSHGDLPVPVPAVAQLAVGWGVSRPATAGGAERRDPVDPPAQHTTRRGHLPIGGIATGADGVVTEGPAQVIGRGELGELATPTGMALLRTFATICEPLPPMRVRTIGVGAGGRDVPGRPNVVRLLLGER